MTDALFLELTALRIELSEETIETQFAEITGALADEPPTAVGTVARVRSAWRRRIATLATIGTALVPIAAVASESSVPGDVLYPVKLTIERVTLLFDGDIDAEHRVDELETLVRQPHDIDIVETHIAETLDAVAETDQRDDLAERVEDAISRFRDTTRDVDTSTEPTPSDRSTDERPTDETPPTTLPATPDTETDRTTTTLRESDATTTVPDRDGTTTTQAPVDSGSDSGDSDSGGSDRGTETGRPAAQSPKRNHPRGNCTATPPIRPRRRNSLVSCAATCRHLSLISTLACSV